MTTDTKTLKQLCGSVRMDVKHGARLAFAKQDKWQQEANGYTVTLRYAKRSYTVDFWRGSGIYGEPTVKGVMECLLSDASSANEDFDSWCGEYGYDTDSRRAEKIYKACKIIRSGLERLLGEDFETFLYADRN